MTVVGKPKACTEAQWSEIKDFVNEMATEWLAYDPRKAWHGTVNLIGRYVAWAYFRQGYPLERVVFRQENVNYFIATALEGRTEKTRSSQRSSLYAVGRVVLPRKYVSPVPEKIAQRAETEPYSETEQLAFAMWANTQPTEQSREHALVILALGFGAGLNMRDINHLKVRDLHIDDAGVVVSPRDGRFVPVLRQWETVLIEAVHGLTPDDYVFRPGRIDSPRNLHNAGSDFLARTKDPKLRPNAYRLRATWIVTHLQAQVPVDVLLPAAGLKEAHSLAYYMKFVTTPSEQEVRQRLRGSVTDTGTGRDRPTLRLIEGGGS